MPRLSKHLFSCVIFLTASAFFRLAVAAPACERIHEDPADRAAGRAKAKEEQLPAPVSPSFAQAQILSKVRTWQTDLLEAERIRDPRKKALIQGTISDFAAQLILQHRNDEFFFLASQISFPLNKKLYEDFSASTFNYGSSLLEAAILAKNHEVYFSLRSLAQKNHWPQDELPQINRWNQTLAKAILSDPILSKEAWAIPRRGGPELEPRMAEFGRLSAKSHSRLKEAVVAKNLSGVFEVLRDLFPAGEIKALIANGKDRPTPGTFVFDYPLESEKPVAGVLNHHRWLHVSILDPRLHRKSLLLGGTYVKKLKFNLRATEYVFTTTDNSGKGFHRFLEGQRINWIRSAEVGRDFVRILLERDEPGRLYENNISGGPRFQEIAFRFDPEQEGRITNVVIRNGDNLLLQKFWDRQEAIFPEQIVSTSGVGFAGKEDLTATQMGSGGNSPR